MQNLYKYFLFIGGVLFLTGCIFSNKAKKIVEKSIAYYKMDSLDGKSILFRFRNQPIQLKINDQSISYKFHRRIIKSTKDSTRLDKILSTQDFHTYVDLMILPFGLKKSGYDYEHVETTTFNGTDYELIKISRGNNNDVSFKYKFIYCWFDAIDNSLDFIGYESDKKYLLAADGINRYKGYILQDYKLLTTKDVDTTSLINFGKLYESDRLITVSELRIEDFKVE